MKCVAVLLISCAIFNVAQSARILTIFPLSSRSHYFLGNAVVRTLVEAGHDVTFISPFIEKNPPKSGGKWTDVQVNGIEAIIKDQVANMFDMNDVNPLWMLVFMNGGSNKLTEFTLSHPNVVKLLNSNEKFDLIIIEQFLNDALQGFAHHFKAPLILFSPIGANKWVNEFSGNPSPPSYVLDLFLSYPSHMSFFERVKNSLVFVLQDLNRHILFLPAQNKILKKHFPNAPDLSVLNNNVSLMLLNSHVSTNQPKPHVPNMIEIGGYHVNNDLKPLPKDIKDFLDNAKDGVIYFSMGSNLKSADMPIEKREAILKTFSKLKQKVLWKWEEDELPGKPNNVKLGKWLPQQDILAHPNVKLFITHGGLLSTTETIFYGKPVLAIPIFGDQKINAAQAEVHGFGRSLPYKLLNEETFTANIKELVTNPKYYANAQKRSSIMHDRPLKPKESLVYWVEHVLRHKGATHLRVSALDLTWYQYLLLDVTLFCGAVLLGSLAVLRLLVKKLCCKKTKKNSSSKVKKS